MVRCRRLSCFLRETFESPLTEKLSFILPFFIITVDIILIEHAIRINEHYIIVFTTLLFVLSLIEITVTLQDIRGHHKKDNLEKTIAIELDKFMSKKDAEDVKILVEDFIKKNPQYNKHIGKVYHIACHVIESKKDD